MTTNTIADRRESTAKRGRSSMRDAGPVRRHLVHLSSLNMPDKMIGRRADVSGMTVTAIREGRRELIRPRVADSLLATTPRPHPRQALVLAFGARRRLGALAVAGHSAEAIADASPHLSAVRVREIRKAEHITWTTHQAVDAAFQTLRGTRGASKAVSAVALREGHHSADEWIDIDDIYEKPRRKPLPSPKTQAGPRCHSDGLDPEIFYSGFPVDTVAALRLCASCPVRVGCLDRALTDREPYGIWGGKTAEQRRTLLKARGIELPDNLDVDPADDEPGPQQRDIVADAGRSRTHVAGPAPRALTTAARAGDRDTARRSPEAVA